MKHLKILNTREKKAILELIRQQWGADFKKQSANLVFLMSKKNNIYLISKDFAYLDDKNLNIDSVGLYFAEYEKEKNDQFRLSIEGSQLIGPLARKNIIEISEEQSKEWLKGNDLSYACGSGCSGFVIIKAMSSATKNPDYIGCGKCKKEDCVILNYVPKSRRINA